MKKQNIVKTNREFQNILATGKYIKNKDFVIYYKNNNLSKIRFGISVGKKIGNAVTRNYYKRQLRNIIDNNKNIYSKSTDYIIIVRKSCLETNYQDLEKSFINLMKKQLFVEGDKNESK